VCIAFKNRGKREQYAQRIRKLYIVLSKIRVGEDFHRRGNFCFFIAPKVAMWREWQME